MIIRYPEPPKLHHSGMMVEYLINQNTIISHNDGAKYFNNESRDAWNKETPLGVNT
jgi:hypothetical protein